MLLSWLIREKQKGQSLVEVALITPLILIALYVPVDFGLAFLMGNALSTVARDGARIGSGLTKNGGTPPGDPDFNNADAATLRDQIVGNLPSLLTARTITVKFYEDTPANCAESIEVSASGTYNLFFAQIMRLFGGSANNMTITRTTKMRYNFQLATNTVPCTAITVNQTYSNL